MDAERRQVTVLFTDVVGFTAFSEKFGEEACFTLMRELASLMDGAVREQGGVSRAFTGDGIMAVFGAPVAFEDAPLRACRSALDILKRLEVDADGLHRRHGIRPKLRIGLNTGAAVVGRVQDGTDAPVTVLGDTVNVAARIQTLANPGSAFMSETTYELVKGMVEATPAGAYEVKGKSERQNVFRLNSVRRGAARFDATVSRGLTKFVGRTRELELLDQELQRVSSGLRLVDLVAEPGMGKSRLLHEFLQRRDQSIILTGNCSTDGQQTPFLPFIEIARGAFGVSLGEAEEDVARKLEVGLSRLALSSARNLGLLLHLLGLNPPADALSGLDGVLIGLRTRELLQQLLGARRAPAPVILVIEDLHWVDSASEQLLDSLIGELSPSPLLIITTRRPEYQPPWRDRDAVTTLQVETLTKSEIHNLIQARLGADIPSESIVQGVIERAEGNPLFAEEIATYLMERGVRTTTPDAGAAATALPASLEALLAARVDRLSPKDRAVLQAASVIGRRFDAQLLSVATGEDDVEARLTAMQTVDLIHREAESGEYAFKHALVRDALYRTLLSRPLVELHGKIATELKRRSGNRLAEVAEKLAHHYSHAGQPTEAFVFLSMAGNKSLGVYSIDEAEAHFSCALDLLDKHPNCASADQIAGFLLGYTRLLTLSGKIRLAIEIFERHLSRIEGLDLDDPRVVLIRHQYVFVLLWNSRYQDAAAMQREISLAARQMGDSLSKAYAAAGEIHVSTFVAPMPREKFDMLKEEAIKAADDTDDSYIKSWTRWVIGWEEHHRGRMNAARDAAHELMEVGKRTSDPRTTGLGLSLLTWGDISASSYAKALSYSEQALSAAITPFDRDTAISAKGIALIFLRSTEDGRDILHAANRRLIANGDVYRLVANVIGLSMCKVFNGDLSGGIRDLKEATIQREIEGYHTLADWYRSILAEIYLQIIAGTEKPPLIMVLRNLPIILKVMLTAPSHIQALEQRVRSNPQIDPEGHHAGNVQLLVGLLHKAKKKPALARQHLSEARRILAQFGETPVLARVDAALAELEAAA